VNPNSSLPITSYADAEAFLDGFINYEKLLGGGVVYDTKSFDLETFRSLLRELGDPHLRYSVIHVAGTKGKGSTCAFLQSILTASGVRTGLYTSPHLTHYRERIAVDGQPIPDHRFCAILSMLAQRIEARRDAAPAQGNFRTTFELLTACAFLYFAEAGVQVAVIETGLGGRLDSTNVFDEPPHVEGIALVNVITAIGPDHQAILGETIEQIAAEKAGILRTRARAVLAPQPTEWGGVVGEIVRSRAREISQSAILDADKAILCDHVSHHEQSNSGRFCLLPEHLPGWGEQLMPSSVLAQNLSQEGMELGSPLSGAHQLDNLRAALGALLALESAGGPRMPLDAVRRGVEQTCWPGRFEIVSREPLIIVDGAHCVLSSRALARTYAELFGKRPAVVVAGFMRDKEAAKMCAELRATMNIAAAIACAPPSPRAMSADQAAAIMSDALGVAVERVPQPADAVRRGLALSAGDQAVVIFGSMFLVGPAKAAVTTPPAAQP
jgi:dihydrofolate synthase / folylpolyglutamate synthase